MTNYPEPKMEKTATTKYQSKVVDRLTGEVAYMTRPCTTWAEAHERAEIKAKKMGDRYAIKDVQ
jgi:hypothetical protein